MDKACSAEDVPEPLSAEALREAARQFSPATSEAFDGFHVRQLALLSDEGLEVLGLILHAVETAGKWPTQVRTLLVVLLAKPTGGFRPIALFAAVFRVWGRARRETAAAWESQYELEYFAAGRGRSATDAVWRAAVLAEAAVVKGEQAAAVLFDMVKFFERINYEKLVRSGLELSFPA